MSLVINHRLWMRKCYSMYSMYGTSHPHVRKTAENSQCKLFKSGGHFRPFRARATPVVLCFWPPRCIPRVPCAYGGEIAHVHEHWAAVKSALMCQLTAVIMKTASQFKGGSAYAGYCRQSRLSEYQWSFLPLCGCLCTLCVLTARPTYSFITLCQHRWIQVSFRLWQDYSHPFLCILYLAKCLSCCPKLLALWVKSVSNGLKWFFNSVIILLPFFPKYCIYTVVAWFKWQCLWPGSY